MYFLSETYNSVKILIKTPPKKEIKGDDKT